MKGPTKWSTQYNHSTDENHEHKSLDGQSNLQCILYTTEHENIKLSALRPVRIYERMRRLLR